MTTSTQLTIPKTINVGFQKREDTYTEKLAYVVYTDIKGVLRKKKSWEDWRNHEIDPKIYTNEPTSGFVLNKSVGGARRSYGWNARNEYIRVYDPRGFEFEISVANLLFILQECTSTRGKGLEGEFVYAWNKADLVLLPVDSFEHTESAAFNKNQTKKVTKKDMVEGCSYLMKDMTNVMYLGRHDYFEPELIWKNRGVGHATTFQGKKHVFLNLDKEQASNPYILEIGFTKLAKKTSEQALTIFASSYDAFIGSVFNAPVSEVLISKQHLLKKDLDDIYFKKLLLKNDKKDNSYFLTDISWTNRDKEKEAKFQLWVQEESYTPTIKNNVCFVPQTNRWGFDKHKSIKIELSEKELFEKEFYTAVISTGKGKTYNILDES